ncbi:MAG: SUMF1/EgtB/PvdO family nonheme iron enzyme [Sneathiella sp.]
MSEFRRQIELAAKRQQIAVISVLAFFVTVGALLALGFLLLKTTVIEISPVSAAVNAVITVEHGAAVYVEGTLFSLSRNPTIGVTSDGFEPVSRVIESNEEGKITRIEMQELPARLILTVVGTKEAVTWKLNGNTLPLSMSLDQKLEPGFYEVEVIHRYFEPETLTFELGRGQTETREIPLIRVHGEIAINITPEDAKLAFDGEGVAEYPATFEKPAGRYSVNIEKEGYLPITDEIEITFNDRAVSRNYQLQLQPAFLEVKVSPAGGQLSLNGKSVSVDDRHRLAANKRYYLKYRKNGYTPEEREIVLKPGEEAQLAINLKLNIGEVNITSSPDAAVYLDGKVVGNTPLSLRLPSFTHKVAIVRQGYRTITKSVVPSANSPQRIDVTLQTEKAAQLAEAKQEYVNSVGMEMVLFQPDDIVLGAPRSESGQRANEFVRLVELTRHFYASRTEVTEAQFGLLKSVSSQSGARDIPASNMSWNEAAQYCNWLSQKEGLREFYSFDGNSYRGFDPNSDGYRLLTEAEWEWLARKAGRIKQTRFPWGDEPVIPKGAGNIADETANGKTRFYVPNYVDGYAGVAPVKSFSKDKSGLYDIFGNLSEWIHDYYNLVPPAEGVVLKDPLGSKQGDQHMLKGANWSSGTLTEIRPAYRASGTEGSDTAGFRVGRYLYGDAK